MTVKEVITEAMRLVGRDDVADAMEKGEFTADQLRLKRAFLTYFNAVRDELARGYFPLDAQEEMYSESKIFPFAEFDKAPIKIKRVTDGEKAVGWRIFPNYLMAEAEKIVVYYEYAPEQLGETDEFSYPSFDVRARLVEYGVAAEYSLVAGDAAASSVWESKYRNEIELLMAKSNVGGRIPPRRWI